MDEELCLGNPVQIAKKDCKGLIKDKKIRKTKRLDKGQWAFLLEAATQMADEDPIFERNLFLISATPAWQPRTVSMFRPVPRTGQKAENSEKFSLVE